MVSVQHIDIFEDAAQGKLATGECGATWLGQNEQICVGGFLTERGLVRREGMREQERLVC
jgi:hypothetical protein